MPFTAEALQKLLGDHHIDSFLLSILGSALGTLSDRGLTGLEIIALCDHMIRGIEAVKKDPAKLAQLRSFATVSRDVFLQEKK